MTRVKAQRAPQTGRRTTLLRLAANYGTAPTTICEASGGPLVHALSQVAAAGETTTGQLPTCRADDNREKRIRPLASGLPVAAARIRVPVPDSSHTTPSVPAESIVS